MAYAVWGCVGFAGGTVENDPAVRWIPWNRVARCVPPNVLESEARSSASVDQADRSVWPVQVFRFAGRRADCRDEHKSRSRRACHQFLLPAQVARDPSAKTRDLHHGPRFTGSIHRLGADFVLPRRARKVRGSKHPSCRPPIGSAFLLLAISFVRAHPHGAVLVMKR